MTIATTGVNNLRSQFRGALLRPGEEGYDEARACGTAPSIADRV